MRHRAQRAPPASAQGGVAIATENKVRQRKELERIAYWSGSQWAASCLMQCHQTGPLLCLRQ